jgi:hypothetical protein
MYMAGRYSGEANPAYRGVYNEQFVLQGQGIQGYLLIPGIIRTFLIRQVQPKMNNLTFCY